MCLEKIKEKFSGFYCSSDEWCKKNREKMCALAIGIPVIAALAVIFGLSVSRHAVIQFMGKTLPHAYSTSEALRLVTGGLLGTAAGYLLTKKISSCKSKDKKGGNKEF